jgi:hypothetical protein
MLQHVVKKVNEMPSVYSQALSEGLQARLDEAERARCDAVGLYAEIDLAADTVCAEARMYDQARQMHDVACTANDPELASRCLETVATTGGRLRRALTEVADMRERHARMMAQSTEQIGVGSVGHVLLQMIEISRDVLGDRPEVAELARRLRNEVRIVDGRVAGTQRTPDMDADDMDSTVPYCAESLKESAVTTIESIASA